MLALATNAVSMDEPCMGVYELNQTGLPGEGIRRTQIILVLRNDTVVECRRDLGPASDFTAAEFRCPGVVVEDGKLVPLHKVGELIDICDWHRAGIAPPPEIEPDADYNARYHDEIDKRRKRKRGLSQFGAKYKIQRST